MTAVISPFREDRDRARQIFPHGEFLEIYCDCSIEICEERDVKGLYKKARAGEVKEFTGISSPYEVPLKPELKVNTGTLSLEESVDQVMAVLEKHCSKLKLLRVDETASVLESSFVIEFKRVSNLNQAKAELQSLGDVQISFLDNKGIW